MEAVKFYNTSFFNKHLQSKIEELTVLRMQSKDVFEQASLGDQIALIEQLQRDYNENIKDQLG